MAARCEDFHAIDFTSLRRLTPGDVTSINWSRAGHLTGQIGIEVDSQYARLTYRHRQIGGAWQEAREIVSFTETGTCFGGRRRWFECPPWVRESMPNALWRWAVPVPALSPVALRLAV
jgi:hypothetical protein